MFNWDDDDDNVDDKDGVPTLIDDVENRTGAPVNVENAISVLMFIMAQRRIMIVAKLFMANVVFFLIRKVLLQGNRRNI